MPKVNLQRTLSVPAVPARAAASSIMHEIAEQRAEWADFALYTDLGSLGLPDVGYVAIPVVLENLRESLEPRHEIAFTLHACKHPEAFPTFEGAIGIDASGPSSAQIWLAGSYSVPMQDLGSFFDHLFARGVAGKTLDNMLDELADAVAARVEKRERNAAHYRLLAAGD